MATSAPLLGGYAVSPRRVGHQVWDQGALYTWDDPKGNPIVSKVQFQQKAELTLPSGFRLAYVKNQMAYASRQNPETGQIEFYEGFQFGNWTRLGSWASGKTKLSGFRVLEGGKILVLSSFEPMRHAASLGYLAILRPDDQRALRVESLVEPSFEVWDKPRLAPQGGVSGMGWMTAGKAPILEDFTRATFDHAADWVYLVLPVSGYVLTLNGETGKIQREGLVFPSAFAKDQKEKKEGVILAWRTAPEGHLLLATRTEEAVFKARPVFQPPYTPDEGSCTEYLHKSTARAIEAFPEILWWELTTDSGSFIRVPVPTGLPDRLMNLDFMRNFDIRFNGDGLPERR